MKTIVAVLAFLMPVLAGLSNSGMFGPTNADISNQYPTLIVASGYAFSIWSVIFLLDIIYGIGQFFAVDNSRNRRIRGPVALGFALTALWSIVFGQQWFWLALIIIWVALACLLFAVIQVSDGNDKNRSPWWQWLPLSLHAGWLTLAAFLDTAQVIVAHDLFSTTHMLPWTIVLFFLVAAVLLSAITYMHGNPWYALAAVWGLVGVYVKQSASSLDGANTAAWVALILAVLVATWSARMLWRKRNETTRVPT